MKRLLIITCLAIAMECPGQENRRHHAISGEVFGLGTVLSGQYDFLFGYSKRGFFDVRAGFGVFAVATIIGTSYPHAITYNFGKGHDHLEIGMGVHMFLAKTS